MLPGSCCRDLVAVLVKYIENGAERGRLFGPVIYHMIPRILPRQGSCTNSCDTVKTKISLIVGCDSSAPNTAWSSTTFNSRGEALMEFLNSSNLEGNESTFCCGSRQEVIDITLRSFGLLESIAGLEVF